jgi:catechol 2,3-dioxygenase-like lactoylglutathione lyase family enzyme
MIGRFLEISVPAPDVQASLEFYESLGFEQATTSDTWSYPYAVVTDGRLFIGLHARVVESPVITFVLPQLARAIESLQGLGLIVDDVQLGDDTFNQATLHDASGHQSVRLLEARTFSPPRLDAPVRTGCGYFSEYGLPARNPASARPFWEQIGFLAMDEQSMPFPRTVLTSDHLNVALYRTRAFRQPLLTFEDTGMSERVTKLRERNLRLSDEMPDSLDERSNAVLIAPEGTRLLLLHSDE